MARAKRKLPAKPAAFFSPHHRGHFCPVIRYPNTKPPPPTIHTPQKPHGSVKRHRPTPEHKKPAAAPNTAGRFLFSAAPPSLLPPSTGSRAQKTPLPLRTPPAAFISPHHRGHFCRRHPIPEHKAPAADDNTHPTKTHGPVKRHRPTPEHKKPATDNTHPTKTSRLGQTAPTDTRTQKNPLPLRTPPAVSAFSKKTAALPKCHSSAPTTAGRRTTPPHTT